MAADSRSSFLGSSSKCNKQCIKSLVKHNCWSAIILGAIMLCLGCVLRSAVFESSSSSSSTVNSSGMLFILIGVFIICMGPFSAIYELVTFKSRDSEQEREVEVGISPRPSESSDPPNYEQAVTGLKSPSATYHMQYYPQVLSPQNLSKTQPPPPSYEDITGIRSETKISINGLNNKNNNVNENRRMTIT